MKLPAFLLLLLLTLAACSGQQKDVPRQPPTELTPTADVAYGWVSDEYIKSIPPEVTAFWSDPEVVEAVDAMLEHGTPLPSHLLDRMPTNKNSH